MRGDIYDKEGDPDSQGSLLKQSLRNYNKQL